MKIEDEEEIFLLPDGSLFFLSPKAGDTALYNCGVDAEDGNTHLSDPAALIVSHSIDTHKQDDDDSKVKRNIDFKDEALKQDDKDMKASRNIKYKEEGLKPIRVEVINNDEVPPIVYIISVVLCLQPR